MLSYKDDQLYATVEKIKLKELGSLSGGRLGPAKDIYVKWDNSENQAY